ncbi:MAG: hypothetical protein GYB65_11865 [Chloroflexi bacterium]|nr:hypothetical protein [Chloroflexota bacterium]
MPISLEAEVGQSVTVEATVFVPRVNAGEPPLPLNFLGLIGFLDQIRFAVDPAHNQFYFGTIAEPGWGLSSPNHRFIRKKMF